MKALSFLLILALEILFLAVVVIKDGWCDSLSRQTQLENVRLAEAMMLTDLALWTEARYTRHPSQADCFTAFQNGPALLDLFPAGTWVSPGPSQKDPGVTRHTSK